VLSAASLSAPEGCGKRLKIEVSLTFEMHPHPVAVPVLHLDGAFRGRGLHHINGEEALKSSGIGRLPRWAAKDPIPENAVIQSQGPCYHVYRIPFAQHNRG
jgi:hypothetical protein